jgi:NAD(P)-dependent dehydrogenase (short-subunit alcohol dehydrogenase family)
MAQRSTVLVTGGNRGLGLESCRQFARRGLYVILTARDDAKGREAAETLASQGFAVEHRRLDISDVASIAALADALRADGVRLDVLVNNGAIEMKGFDGEVARKTLATNMPPNAGLWIAKRANWLVSHCSGHVGGFSTTKASEQGHGEAYIPL